MNKKYFTLVIIIFIIFIFQVNSAFSWSSFMLPRFIGGVSAGYFRISLDDFDKVYSSRWNETYGANFNVRFYKSTFATLQYSQYHNDDFRQSIAVSHDISDGAKWNQKIYNIGIRWYSDSRGKWNFYSGFGLTFIDISEPAGISVFENVTADDNDGRGFFLELGFEYIILPHVSVGFEFEASSAGEGGTPGFVGHSIGGYTFQLGTSFHF